MIFSFFVLLIPRVVLQFEEKVSFQPTIPFSQVSESKGLYGYGLDSIEVRQAVVSEPWRSISPRGKVKNLTSVRPILPREKIAHQVLRSDRCYPSQLLLKLGLELEEKFPEETERKRAEDVYTKALACSQDYSALISGYRLALLLIWREDYAQASRILEILQKLPEVGDLVLRISYWQSYCARLQNQTLKQMEFDSRILQNYPLSFYSMILSHPTVVSDYVDLNRPDELDISFRPEHSLALAALTRKIELLLVSGAQEEAADLLIEYTPRVQQESEHFRLYWSILLERSGKKIQAYQNLIGLVHGDPRRLVKSYLKFLYPREFLDLVQRVDPELDPFLVLSLIRQESVFNPLAVSSAQAFGLMQLQYPTARLFQHSLHLRQLYQPEVNVQIGTAYLKKLIQDYDGSIELALVAYNAGPARTRKWVKRYPTRNRLLFLDLLPVKETREYVASILRNYRLYQNLYPEEFEQIKNKAHFEIGKSD